MAPPASVQVARTRHGRAPSALTCHSPWAARALTELRLLSNRVCRGSVREHGNAENCALRRGASEVVRRTMARNLRGETTAVPPRRYVRCSPGVPDIDVVRRVWIAGPFWRAASLASRPRTGPFAGSISTETRRRGAVVEDDGFRMRVPSG